MTEVLRRARLVAGTTATVLLTGETGTGKGVLARFIHRVSNRTERPFVSIHCGAIPENLVESELFGHEKGAFTGASDRHIGCFERADQGTMFLDEVATLTRGAQIKLLQVLQERCLRRVGGQQEIDVDVRVIAATNVDLAELCNQGEFRRDLMFRLNVFPIEVPPLHERQEDIPDLVRRFLQRLDTRNRKGLTGCTPEALEALCGYSWPGNVRELENVVERAYILEQGSQIGLDSLPVELTATHIGEAIQGMLNTDLSLAEARAQALGAFEQSYLTAQLRRHHGAIAKTAAASGITPRQLHKLMTKYALHKEDFRDKGTPS
jgi:DNA-binding NtrC family response regulator